MQHIPQQTTTLEVPNDSELDTLDSEISSCSKELVLLMKKRKAMNSDFRLASKKSGCIAFVANSNGNFKDYYGLIEVI